MQRGGAEQPAGERAAKLDREGEDDRGNAWKQAAGPFFLLVRDAAHLLIRWMHSRTNRWMLQRVFSI